MYSTIGDKKNLGPDWHLRDNKHGYNTLKKYNRDRKEVSKSLIYYGKNNVLKI